MENRDWPLKSWKYHYNWKDFSAVILSAMKKPVCSVLPRCLWHPTVLTIYKIWQQNELEIMCKYSILSLCLPKLRKRKKKSFFFFVITQQFLYLGNHFSPFTVLLFWNQMDLTTPLFSCTEMYTNYYLSQPVIYFGRPKRSDSTYTFSYY